VYSALISFVLILAVRETPWTRSDFVNAGTPWDSAYGEDRKERRENFFNDLNAAAPASIAQAPVSEAVPSAHSQFEGSREISQLPWKSYESTGSRESFSRAFLWPIANGRISSPFGTRGSGFHEGIDIRAQTGTPIRAAADGVVVFSGWINGYGKTIVVYHGDFISTLYAHNSQNIREQGDQIRQGQLIGYVGQTGSVSGSHLHFEVRRSGKPLNPMSYSYSRHPLLAAQ